MSELRTVCVYCGSAAGRDPAYARAAEAVAEALAARGIGLVYGGGRVGLMGIVADAVLSSGGQVTGVIPQFLLDREVGHTGLTELRVVATMHERKLLMAELADGFVVLPGGVGTLEELVETLSWSQLGLHGKPIGLLDTEGFWQPFVGLLDHMTGEGFVSVDHRGFLVVSNEPEALVTTMTAWEAPAVTRWLRTARET